MWCELGHILWQKLNIKYVKKKQNKTKKQGSKAISPSQLPMGSVLTIDLLINYFFIFLYLPLSIIKCNFVETESIHSSSFHVYKDLWFEGRGWLVDHFHSRKYGCKISESYEEKVVNFVFLFRQLSTSLNKNFPQLINPSFFHQVFRTQKHCNMKPRFTKNGMKKNIMKTKCEKWPFLFDRYPIQTGNKTQTQIVQRHLHVETSVCKTLSPTRTSN